MHTFSTSGQILIHCIGFLNNKYSLYLQSVVMLQINGFLINQVNNILVIKKVSSTSFEIKQKLREYNFLVNIMYPIELCGFNFLK